MKTVIRGTVPKTIPWIIASSIGYPGKAGRWQPRVEFKDIPGAWGVRSPSRAYPNSYYMHAQSRLFSCLFCLWDYEKWAVLVGLSVIEAGAWHGELITRGWKYDD